MYIFFHFLLIFLKGNIIYTEIRKLRANLESQRDLAASYVKITTTKNIEDENYESQEIHHNLLSACVLTMWVLRGSSTQRKNFMGT